ncbi:MAG: DUF2254 domain-containing protein [Alphaproteobacteria bacterium]|nr:DUF2254 domain-containing protein [Alphaproteobacteria bacterium]MBU0795735.1 DUF2254 domain-containing protein [Alphaproteobacteria bacterium]MBU0887358.1 DUF2254 domain-containing protein [Alphaproteobacteria bacterium]MBU1811761.1 DUF2254 domain-containing protein [Alphaproteobacteria bacterium]MBU2089342.1 DUF2254 domain-containing protein [Alphaproteobacteria bacterium]
MTTRLYSLFFRIRSALWFRPTLASIAAAVLAGLIAGFDSALPQAVAVPAIDPESVKDLLNLLASSMLTVTTVTLSALMVVLNMAVSQASPRALPGLMADEVTQNALSTFIATFVFALFGLLGLGLGYYDASGQTVLFGAGLFLTIWALRYLVQWIHHIAGTLRLGNIVARVQSETANSIKRFHEKPLLDAHPAPPRQDLPTDARLLAMTHSGYLGSIDMEGLQEKAEEQDIRIEILVRPEVFLHPDRPALAIFPAESELSDEAVEKLLQCLTLGEERSYHQDPLLGLQILGEIASRALSPGINDPKTAVICLDRLEALLSQAAKPSAPQEAPKHDRLFLPVLDFGTMIDRALHSIARDGAKAVDVVLRQIAALERIAQAAPAGHIHSVLKQTLDLVQDFAEAGLVLETDRDTVRQAATRLRHRLSGTEPA